MKIRVIIKDNSHFILINDSVTWDAYIDLS